MSVCARSPVHDTTGDHRTRPNTLERRNGEIKRRTDVVKIFPREEVIVCVVCALLLAQYDVWAVTRRYMTPATLAGLSDDGGAKPRQIAAA
jgi:transposase-like protein